MQAGTRVRLGGTRADVWKHEQVLRAVATRLGEAEGPPLLLASANLDHIAHFGPEGPSRHLVDFDDPASRWLVLLDGIPLVWRCRKLLGDREVPQLAGSDLLADLLQVAADAGGRVGVLGGSPETHDALRLALEHRAPEVHLVECWAPSRADLDSTQGRADLADKVAASQIDLLVVALGKPRQEAFLAEHGAATQAKVALAFGAAIDFYAGRVDRAPQRVRRAGLEWLWRLAHEPRRLARRYLVEGPPGAVALLRDSCVLPAELAQAPSSPLVPSMRAEFRGEDRRRASVPAPAAISVPEQRPAERRKGADRRLPQPAQATAGPGRL